MLHNSYTVFFFFFKQKTAYEIRPCDWSSDVCSSDLELGRSLGRHHRSTARDDCDIRAIAERAALAQQEAHPHRGVPGAGAAVAREGTEQLDDDRPITQCGRDIEAVAADRVIHGTLSDLLSRRVELRHPEIRELAPLL